MLDRLTPKQLRAALKKLGLNNTRAAIEMQISRRQLCRYINAHTPIEGPVVPLVALWLENHERKSANVNP